MEDKKKERKISRRIGSMIGDILFIPITIVIVFSSIVIWIVDSIIKRFKKK